jgi:uncharacterized protein (DUF1778 family)
MLTEEDCPMPKARSPKQVSNNGIGRSLMVRLDDESKSFLAQAAQLRRISVSDYVRTVTVAQARKEVLAAREQIVALAPAEQLAFWTALNDVPFLTDAQRWLATTMRGRP